MLMNVKVDHGVLMYTKISELFLVGISYNCRSVTSLQFILCIYTWIGKSHTPQRWVYKKNVYKCLDVSQYVFPFNVFYPILVKYID